MNQTNNFSDSENDNRKIKWYWDLDVMPIDIFCHGGSCEEKEYYETRYSINDDNLCDLDFIDRAEYFFFLFKSLTNTYLEVDGKVIDIIPLDEKNPMTEHFRLRSYQLADVEFKQTNVLWLKAITNQLAEYYDILKPMGNTTKSIEELLKDYPDVPEDRTLLFKTETSKIPYARAVGNRHIILSEILYPLLLHAMKINFEMYFRNKRENIGNLLFNRYFPLFLHTLDPTGTPLSVLGQIIYFDSDMIMYAKKLTSFQIMFMMLHEISHIMGYHAPGVNSNRNLMESILGDSNDEFIIKVIEHLDNYKNEHEMLYKELEADINSYVILLKMNEQDKEDVFTAINNTFSFYIVAEQLRNRIKGVEGSERLGHFYVRKSLLNSFQKSYQYNYVEKQSSLVNFFENLYTNLQRLLIQETSLEYILNSIRNTNKNSDLLPENR